MSSAVKSTRRQDRIAARELIDSRAAAPSPTEPLVPDFHQMLFFMLGYCFVSK